VGEHQVEVGALQLEEPWTWGISGELESGSCCLLLGGSVTHVGSVWPFRRDLADAHPQARKAIGVTGHLDRHRNGFEGRDVGAWLFAIGAGYGSGSARPRWKHNRDPFVRDYPADEARSVKRVPADSVGEVSAPRRIGAHSTDDRCAWRSHAAIAQRPGMSPEAGCLLSAAVSAPFASPRSGGRLS
jgi:hypothetical protein